MSDSSINKYMSRVTRAGRAALRALQISQIEDNSASPALSRRGTPDPVMASTSIHSTVDTSRDKTSLHNTVVSRPSLQPLPANISPISSPGNELSPSSNTTNEDVDQDSTENINPPPGDLVVHTTGVTTAVIEQVADQLAEEVVQDIRDQNTAPQDNDPMAVIQAMVNQAVAARTQDLEAREAAVEEALRQLQEDRAVVERDRRYVNELTNTERARNTDTSSENRAMTDQLETLQRQMNELSNAERARNTNSSSESRALSNQLENLQKQMKELQNSLKTIKPSVTTAPNISSQLNPSAPQFVWRPTFTNTSSSIRTLPSTTVTTTSITSSIPSSHAQDITNPSNYNNQELFVAFQQFLQGQRNSLPVRSSHNQPSLQTNVLDSINRLAPHGIYSSSSETSNPSLVIPPPSTTTRNYTDCRSNTNSSSFNPTTNITTSPLDNSIVQNLSSLIATRLPTIEIEKFTGDSKQYETFKTKFKTLMASTNATPEEQARTLYQSLGGDVVTQLDHIPNLCDQGAYNRLWHSLDAEFGKFQNGAQDYVNELTSRLQTWPLARSSGDVSALYKFLRSYNTTLELEGQEHELETSHIRKLILGTLTGQLKGRVIKLIDDNNNSSRPIIKNILEEMKTATRLMSLDENARGAKISKPSHKVNQIDSRDEGELLTNVNKIDSRDTRTQNKNVRIEDPPSNQRPNLGQGGGILRNNYYNDRYAPRDHGSQYPYRSPPRSGNSFMNTYSPVRNRPGDSASNRQSSPNRTFDRNFYLEREQRFSKRCMFCSTNDHESENCTQLSSPQEYKDILYKYKLCYNCLHQNHSNYNCLLPKRCAKSCNDSSKHSTVVCTHNV